MRVTPFNNFADVFGKLNMKKKVNDAAFAEATGAKDH